VHRILGGLDAEKPVLLPVGADGHGAGLLERRHVESIDALLRSRPQVAPVVAQQRHDGRADEPVRRPKGAQRVGRGGPGVDPVGRAHPDVPVRVHLERDERAGLLGVEGVHRRKRLAVEPAHGAPQAYPELPLRPLGHGTHAAAGKTVFRLVPRKRRAVVAEQPAFHGGKPERAGGLLRHVDHQAGRLPVHLPKRRIPASVVRVQLVPGRRPEPLLIVVVQGGGLLCERAARAPHLHEGPVWGLSLNPASGGHPQVLPRPVAHVPHQVVGQSVGRRVVGERRRGVPKHPRPVRRDPEVALAIDEEAPHEDVLQLVGVQAQRFALRPAVQPLLGGHPERPVGPPHIDHLEAVGAVDLRPQLPVEPVQPLPIRAEPEPPVRTRDDGAHQAGRAGRRVDNRGEGAVVVPIHAPSRPHPQRIALRGQSTRKRGPRAVGGEGLERRSVVRKHPARGAHPEPPVRPFGQPLHPHVGQPVGVGKGLYRLSVVVGQPISGPDPEPVGRVLVEHRGHVAGQPVLHREGGKRVSVKAGHPAPEHREPQVSLPALQSIPDLRLRQPLFQRIGLEGAALRMGGASRQHTPDEYTNHQPLPPAEPIDTQRQHTAKLDTRGTRRRGLCPPNALVGGLACMLLRFSYAFCSSILK